MNRKNKLAPLAGRHVCYATDGSLSYHRDSAAPVGAWVFLATGPAVDTAGYKSFAPNSGADSAGGYVPSLALAFRIARAFNKHVEDVFTYDVPVRDDKPAG